MTDFDTIVIGSGFGGAVMACRLAEKGARVLVLERGRRWAVEDYPSVSKRHWIWDEDKPERLNGWLDFRFFGDMSVALGAGVGGGSLIYANVSIDAKPEVFEQGWPAAIRFPALKPHYDTVAKMLVVRSLPENQLTARTRLMQEAAAAIGAADRFQLVPQAVAFDPQWHYGLDSPHDRRHSRRWVNDQGVEQGTCIHCGNCDIGCPTLAKNSLDLNYLARAEQLGAEVRALHQVRCITPAAGGYQLQVRDLASGRDVNLSAERVVISAGSVGSTELLLRCRDQYRTLPKLSARLGEGWTSNGDFLTPAWYRDREVSPTRGPTISGAIDFLDGSEGGARFFVEDGGFPDLIGNLMEKGGRHYRLRNTRAGRALTRTSERRDPARWLMPWFGQAVDEPGGTFYLGRSWLMPWRRDKLKLKWDYRKAELGVQGLADMHLKLTRATGGEAATPATWRWFRNLVTPHPLGGCNMADDAAHGVVDDRGEVFGYPNLFVMDGAVVPTALGLNPSKTIAALAEFAAARIA
ncbi:MAG: GMC oxidoreductase [Alcanivoracaceae bacterium]